MSGIKNFAGLMFFINAEYQHLVERVLSDQRELTEEKEAIIRELAIETLTSKKTASAPKAQTEQKPGSATLPKR